MTFHLLGLALMALAVLAAAALLALALIPSDLWQVLTRRDKLDGDGR